MSEESPRKGRERLVVRVTRLAEQGREPDLQGSTAAERLAMMWPLAVDAWAFMGEPVAEQRLPRHITRVLRYGFAAEASDERK